MACMGPEPTPEELARKRELDATKTKVYIKLRTDYDNLTKMMCSLLGTVEEEVQSLSAKSQKGSWNCTLAERINNTVFYSSPLSPEINKWWEEHKKLDAKRVALAKLTPEERKLLGVEDV